MCGVYIFIKGEVIFLRDIFRDGMVFGLGCVILYVDDYGVKYVVMRIIEYRGSLIWRSLFMGIVWIV